MDRRSFIVAAGAAAAVATQASAATRQGGQVVRLSGYLRPAADITGHYFVLSPDGRHDPATADAAAWPKDLVRVYPRDARRMRVGKVNVTGKLYRGAFIDEATGHAAGAVLTEAVLV